MRRLAATLTRRGLVVLGVLCLGLQFPADARALATENLGSAPLVAEPCGVLPQGGLCFQGTFTSPHDHQTLTIPAGQLVIRFRGVAERDTKVYVFFLRGDGTLVNELPFEVTAGSDGVFMTDPIELAYMLDGGQTRQDFRGAAYFRTTVAEHPNGETFFQITGTPIVHFSLAIPPAPAADPRCGDRNRNTGEECDDGNTWSGDGCSATCTNETLCGNGKDDPGEQCDPPNGTTCSATCRTITCDNGTLDAGEVCDRTNFGGKTCTSETGGTKPNGALTCRNDCTAIGTTQCTGTAGGACGNVGEVDDCSVALDMRRIIPMDPNLLVFNRNRASPTLELLQPSSISSTAIADQARAAVRVGLISEIRAAACAELSAPTDPTVTGVLTACSNSSIDAAFIPQTVELVLSDLNAKVCTPNELGGQPDAASYGICGPAGRGNISMLLGTTTVAPTRCIWNGTCYTRSYITGNSPLIFVTSPVPVEATVQVAPRGGVVTVADPPQTNGAWRVTAGAAASPLYYEFSDGVLGQLALRDDEGWTVEAGAAESLLRSLLLSWGYDPAEVETFLARDVRGKLPGSGTLEVRVADPSVVSQVLPLAVTPTPARVERVLFHLHAVTDPRELQEPDVSALLHAGATGLTVREMGAVLIGG